MKQTTFYYRFIKPVKDWVKKLLKGRNDDHPFDHPFIIF